MFKSISKAKKVFTDASSQLGSLVDPWSYKRAGAPEKAAFDQAVEALREQVTIYKGEGEAEAENATAVDSFHKAQVIKHADKFLAQLDAYKAGTDSLHLPLDIVTNNARALTQKVADLVAGVVEVVPVVIPAGSNALADRVTNYASKLRGRVEALRDQVKSSNGNKP
jgi:hypothetical protein